MSSFCSPQIKDNSVLELAQLNSHTTSCFIVSLYDFGIQVSVSTTFAFGLLRYSRESFKQAKGFGSLYIHLAANGSLFACLVWIWSLLF